MQYVPWELSSSLQQFIYHTIASKRCTTVGRCSVPESDVYIFVKISFSLFLWRIVRFLILCVKSLVIPRKFGDYTFNLINSQCLLQNFFEVLSVLKHLSLWREPNLIEVINKTTKKNFNGSPNQKDNFDTKHSCCMLSLIFVTLSRETIMLSVLICFNVSRSINYVICLSLMRGK